MSLGLMRFKEGPEEPLVGAEEEEKNRGRRWKRRRCEDRRILKRRRIILYFLLLFLIPNVLIGNKDNDLKTRGDLREESLEVFGWGTGSLWL